MAKFWDWLTGNKPQSPENHVSSQNRPEPEPEPEPTGLIIHGFYDPEVAEKVGSSIYQNEHGEEVEITTICREKDHFRKRRIKPRSVRYVGQVRCFLRRNPESDSGFLTDIPFEDIAMWFMFYSSLFDQYYPFDESLNNDFDGEYVCNSNEAVKGPIGGSEASPPEPPISDSDETTRQYDAGYSGGHESSYDSGDSGSSFDSGD